MTIIFFTRTLPNTVADDLTRQGHTTHEALAISEVLVLAEQHPEAVIIIDHDVESAAAKMIQQHYPTLYLKLEATAAKVLCELSHLTRDGSIQ